MKRLIGGLMMSLMGCLALVVSMPGAASAEITDYAEETWGVYDSVTSGTLTDRIDSEVMAIEQIGNTVYVGGKFTNVRPWAGGPSTPRTYLAAFDATTGDYIASFDPDLDGPVYSLQASPDGSRLFVGGEFGDVAGVANTRALVALDPASGAVDTSWKAQLKLDGRAVVYTIGIDDDWLYVGGNFSAVGGAQGVPSTPVSRAVKLDIDTAFPDLDWRPTISGGSVWGLTPSPDGNTVYVAGYFSTVNFLGGTQGFVGVDNDTGSTVRAGRLPHNNPGRPHYLDVVAVNDLVFVAGMEHITYVLDASDLSIRTRHSTGGVTNALFQRGGDYQDLEVVGNRVYASCHCRGDHFADGDVFRNIPWSRVDPIKFVAAYSAVDGSYIPSFTLDLSGSSGSWAVHGAPDGCLWIGGDLTRAGRQGGGDQNLGGFSRHCDENHVVDSERPSRPSNVAGSSDGLDITLTWSAATDDVGVAGYQIWRATSNGGTAEQVGTSATLSFTDTVDAGGTYWYYLRAYDAAGNVSWRTGYVEVGAGAAADTERPGRASDVVGAAAGDSVVLSWTAATDNVGVAGYDVYRAASEGGAATVVGQSTSTSFTDAGLASGTYWYYLRAYDAAGNVGWRTGWVSVTVGPAADTERPSTPQGLVVDGTAPGEIALRWTESTDNVGVTGYLVFDAASDTQIATVTGSSTTVTGLTPGQSYSLYVRAIDGAGNISWRSNIQTATAS